MRLLCLKFLAADELAKAQRILSDNPELLGPECIQLWEATLSSLGGSGAQNQQPSWPAIALPKNTAAVTMCVTEVGTAAMILLPTGEAQGIHIPDFASAQLNNLLLRGSDNPYELRVHHPEDLRGWMVDVPNVVEPPWDQGRAKKTIEATLSALQCLLDPILGRLPDDVRTLSVGDGSERLFDRFAIAYAPSLTALADSLTASKPDLLKLYVYANPGRDLTFSEAEARAIERQFPGAVMHDARAAKLEILQQIETRSCTSPAMPSSTPIWLIVHI
jgi:hypothetical protein